MARNPFSSAYRFAILALPLLAYFAFQTKNYYWDGVAFAIDIEKRTNLLQLLHPNHLIYSLWGAALQSMLGGPPIRALEAMQAANAACAGLAVFLMYALLRRSTPPDTAVWGSLLFGFSATWWRFASDANAYIPATTLLLATVVTLRPDASVFRCILAGLLHAFAMLFHQLAVVFFAVAWAFLPPHHRRMAAYHAAATLPVLAAYLLAYSSRISPAEPDFQGLMQWATYHSPDSSFVFNPLSNLLQTIQGTLRLIVGGKLRSFVLEPSSIAAVVTVAGCTILAALRLAQTRLPLAKPPPPARGDLAWLLSFGLFLFVWMPQNTFYRLFYLPALVRLAIQALSRFRPALPYLVAGIACWNYAFVAYPQSRNTFNPALTFAAGQKTQWTPGTPIVFHVFHPDLWTVSYFSPQAVWISMPTPDLTKLNEYRDFARREGKTLWMEKSARDAIASIPSGPEWLALHEDRGAAIDRQILGVRFEFVAIRD